jgi:hypothetical protein
MIGVLLLVACEGNVHELQEGDCYNNILIPDAEKTIEVMDVEMVTCEELHENEVYAKFDLPDSGWAGDKYVYEQAEIGCLNRFKPFIGIEYDRSTLVIDIMYPLEEGWKELGDRKVVCSVVEEPLKKVYGSARGSRR